MDSKHIETVCNTKEMLWTGALCMVVKGLMDNRALNRHVNGYHVFARFFCAYILYGEVYLMALYTPHMSKDGDHTVGTLNLRHSN